MGGWLAPHGPGGMKRVVILTGHFARQKRRGSILWLADGMQALGWHVALVTVGYSRLSVLRRDPRLVALGQMPPPGLQNHSATLDSLFSLSPVHPLRVLDWVAPRFAQVMLRHWARLLPQVLQGADRVIIESGLFVLFAPLVRSQAGEAQMIYRVNDDLRLLRQPSCVLQAEMAHQLWFDRISTSSPDIAARFTHSGVTIDPMGFPHNRLTTLPPSPYHPRAKFEAVCAGTTQIDLPALCRIAAARPQWRLHVLGRLCRVPQVPGNLVLHGEQNFDATLAYVAYADIGLAPYLDAAGIEYQRSNSNRMLLYRHFGLPILGPDRLCHPTVPAIIGYGDPQVWQRCENALRQPEDIPDWSHLAQSLVA